MYWLLLWKYKNAFGIFMELSQQFDEPKLSCSYSYNDEWDVYTKHKQSNQEINNQQARGKYGDTILTCEHLELLRRGRIIHIG